MICIFVITTFQKKVYDAVRRIPRGKVAAYKAVAAAIGNPQAVRAVGNTLNKNRNPQVPCHRIIRSDGHIGGFARGLAAKFSMLRKEGVIIQKYRVPRRCIICL